MEPVVIETPKPVAHHKKVQTKKRPVKEPEQVPQIEKQQEQTPQPIEEAEQEVPQS
jgi:hypothetical protein